MTQTLTLLFRHNLHPLLLGTPTIVVALKSVLTSYSFSLPSQTITSSAGKTWSRQVIEKYGVIENRGWVFKEDN